MLKLLACNRKLYLIEILFQQARQASRVPIAVQNLGPNGVRMIFLVYVVAKDPGLPQLAPIRRGQGWQQPRGRGAPARG